MTEGLSYRAAGVDIDAGDRAVALMRSRVAAASRPEVVGGLGGFAGLFALDTARYTAPLLASSTDGVGTKIAVARAMDRHDTVGIDLVAMVVDDLVVCGAEPLFMLDYIACGAVDPERIAAIVGGVADGCRTAGCALVGGETAEHPGLMEPGEYDLAGTGVGVVEAAEVLGPERVRAGDALVAMASSGLHSNGFSLARRVLLPPGGPGVDAPLPELGTTVGEALLVPTRIYARDCLALLAEPDVDVHAFSHITGGGFAANLARVVPAGLVARVDRASWRVPPVFGAIASRGPVTGTDMEGTFNQGVGMVAVVAAADADRAVRALAARSVPAWVAGTLGSTGPGEPGAAELVGSHPA